MSEYSRFPLPTDTAHIRIESRQYRIFRFDLGEGVARWKVAVGAAIIVPWFVLMGLVLRVPPLAGNGKGSLLYLFPAVIMTWAALRPDAGGRPRYALWLDRFRYWIRRAAPMIDNPISRPTPGRPFIVSASWVVLDPGRSRRVRATSAATPVPPTRLSPLRLPAWPPLLKEGKRMSRFIAGSRRGGS